MKYYGFEGVLVLEMVNEHIFHVITYLNVKTTCKQASSFETHVNLVDLSTVRMVTRALSQWKLRHTQGYRRRYKLLMGPKRRIRTDDTPVGPLFN
ncbi:MAG: hypothetical protein CBC12_07330 [Candidatus Puniceispirillum sp. TMED52]|nr:MAG: hypothetical protein CBC12_07330 [Candidatus Puniceispirillum sp. TMED52]